MRTVVLVPRRAGFEDRDRLWHWCREWWRKNVPDIEMFEGHHDHGLFNRSAAINLAARKAGEWDVALIIDADVILDDPRQAYTAAHTAQEAGKLVAAFTYRNNLSRRGTDKLLAGHSKDDWSRDVERVYHDQHSSVIAVPFELFNEVGGFDEGFRGWGFEDTAFAVATETFSGPRVTMPGIVWHLWHPTAPEKSHSPARMANWNRVNRYKDIIGDRDAMRALLASNEEEKEQRETTIPKILHRVVPERTSKTVEKWWDEFAALHPDWRLMTWRDPLDPEQFPLTSPLWGQVRNGAQLADLVRLEVLWNWGGHYLDSDMQPFRNMNSLCQLSAYAAWEDEKVVPNAVMGARREHPAIQALLDLCIQRVGNDKSTWFGGPGATTEVFVGRDDVLLLPPESFYPVHYKDPDREEKMTNFDPAAHPATFAMHWFANSWAEDPRERHPLP